MKRQRNDGQCRTRDTSGKRLTCKALVLFRRFCIRHLETGRPSLAPVRLSVVEVLLSGRPHTSMHKTDEELVERASRGNTDAFNDLVVRWERPIHALAYRVLGREEDARDVCQEAFMRAFRGLKGFKGKAKFSSWLYRIALNLCRDWLRRERRARLVQPLEDFDLVERRAVDPISETVEDLIVRRDLGRAVSKVMAALPEDQRIAIVLKEYHGLTFREISELMGCPLSTVKTRLYQGLSVLRGHLEHSGLKSPVPARSGRADSPPVSRVRQALPQMARRLDVALGHRKGRGARVSGVCER